ncbi:NAD(P)/FAD-dependent oxidoreductase [Halogranum rubrum]|nr:NAD(P)-binding protein [Halogranum salarium]
MTDSLAIVGAGAAGAGAAYALRDSDVDVTIFEKSRGVCGRAATRRKEGCRYDHGANYIKDADGRTTDLLSELGEDGLVDIEEPVWTFDADGQISEGDGDRDAHKWTWEDGITQLAKRLLAQTDVRVDQPTRIASVERGDHWHVTDTDGETHGPFDSLLLTPPAPQTAALLAESKWNDERLPALIEAVGAVSYRTIRTYVLDYGFELDVPYYALVNTDKNHAVGWLSREECKPGHVPDGETLLVVQMSPEWSTDHYDDPLDESVPTVAQMVAELLDDERLATPEWVDDQGWRYALPNDGAVDDVIRSAEDERLYFAGDWVVGDARVHAALWNGIETGERIGESLRGD